ncbi:MAG TPA: hypothetical protein PK971_14615, partial [Saprospiraceae bacterium]|nr:hypothetical protein [Saprospiraceae bacterium]
RSWSDSYGVLVKAYKGERGDVALFYNANETFIPVYTLDQRLASFGKMRDMLCKIDTSTLQPVWTRLGPLPQGAEARLYGRDLVADSDGLVSTFSGDTTGSDLEETHFFIQKHDFDGNLLWMRSGSIVGSARPFVEDIVSTPDGYMLYGADFQSDTGRLFLIKTDKIGSPDRFLRFKHAPGEVNTTFGELPARSKALVQAENLYLSATSQDALGQTQALLIKTDLNGWVNDSCNLIRFNSGTTIDWITPANYAASPEMRPGQISTQAASTQTDIPGILLTRLCGAEGTCPDLPDLQVTLDSITCRDGNPLLYYTICNVGGQAYDGGLFLSVYDRNPLTDTAKLITFTIGNASDPIPPGECYPGIPFSSDIFLQNSFELDTFKRLYMLLGAGPNVSTPIPLSGFPYPPHAPECGYLNNLSEIEVPIHLCGTCDDPVTFAKKIGTPDQSEEAYSMCLSSDRQHLYLWGKQGASPIVTKLSTRGDIVWVRTLPVNANILIEPSEIFEDSDGKLALCGTFGGSPSNRQALALRYDPDADQVLWLRLYPL